MNFNKPKHEVIEEARREAMSELMSKLSQLNYTQVNSIQYVLQEAIVAAIDGAITSLVNNVYTDDEFERDIKLKT